MLLLSFLSHTNVSFPLVEFHISRTHICNDSMLSNIDSNQLAIGKTCVPCPYAQLCKAKCRHAQGHPDAPHRLERCTASHSALHHILHCITSGWMCSLGDQYQTIHSALEASMAVQRGLHLKDTHLHTFRAGGMPVKSFLKQTGMLALAIIDHHNFSPLRESGLVSVTAASLQDGLTAGLPPQKLLQKWCRGMQLSL